MSTNVSDFLTLINNYRSQNRAPPLTLSPTLMTSSQWMATDMANNNYFSHTDRTGRDPFTRMADYGYPANTSRGENIAAGSTTASEAFTQWQTACDPDPSGSCTYAHRQNMLNPAYQAIGIAIATNPSSTYGTYWVTDFGSVVDSSANTVVPPIPRTVSPTVPQTSNIWPWILLIIIIVLILAGIGWFIYGRSI